jgi:exoribonuclease R
VSAPRRRVLVDAQVLRDGFASIREEHGVQVGFSEAALSEAVSAAGAPLTGRVDLTQVPFVTLDPPDSQDLDQAMHLERSGAGYRVRYAIADLAAFVLPDGQLDRSLRKRALTIYCPDLRVPLHPTVLSEGAASLLPGQDRPAVVWDFGLDEQGEVEKVTVLRALVRSRARLDYPSEQARLDAGTADEVMQLLVEVGRARSRIERARGGVSLGRPEQEVVGAPGGGWTLAFRAALPLEEHNAQISLMTGMSAAAMMLDAGVGILRTMPAAAPEDLSGLRRRALALGVPWADGVSYPDMLAGLDRTRPATAAFLNAAVGLFRGARWQPFRGAPPADVVHGAVGAPYAHVTAPLRRLVDRYGTQVCLAVQEGREPPEWVVAALDFLGPVMADGARRASSVDRACTDLVEAAVLAPHVGEEFDGVALDEHTVQLLDPAVVARTDDGGLPVGRPVRVRLVTADPQRRQIRLRRVTRAAGAEWRRS